MKAISPQDKKEGADDKKTITIPQVYEMKNYQHEGVLQQLAFMLVRPPRFLYNPKILKPSKKLSETFTMEEFEIPFPLTLYKQEAMDYVILYLHGNGSSRYQGSRFISNLPKNAGLACFDFTGCGIRGEGQYITLGQRQCKDVDIAAAFLKGQGYKVVGWGRSMGAVSLLLSQELDLMVADSAYSDLSIVCKQSSSKFLPKACCCIFHCIYPCVFACIKGKVNSLSGLTIDQMKINQHLRALPQHKQICFLHGQEDTLIASHHSQALYDSFSGRKKLILFKGTHNSIRQIRVIAEGFNFIQEGLEKIVCNQKIKDMDNTKMQILEQQMPLQKIIVKSQASKSKDTKITLKRVESETSECLVRQQTIRSSQKPEKEEQFCQCTPSSGNIVTSSSVAQINGKVETELVKNS